MKSKSKLDETLEAKLATRRQNGRLRQLTVFQWQNNEAIDFCSNDYLGLARSKLLQQNIHQEKEKVIAKDSLMNVSGSTGSRLVSGNNSYYLQLEQYLSRFYNREDAIVCNSGYDANLGLLGCLPQSGDIILYDELIHNSCREGMKLSRATSYEFTHNSLKDLSECFFKLGLQNKQHVNVFILVESIYSMDGDVAPLVELCDFSSRYPNCYLIVDEAHSTGIYGPGGSGLVRELNLEDQVYCCVHTFGKGMGCHGSVIVGSSILKEYLLNYSRPTIYSTSLPLDSLCTIKCSHEMSLSFDKERIYLNNLIQYFRKCIEKLQCQDEIIPSDALLPSNSPIQAIVFPGNDRVISATLFLRKNGFNVVAIRSPTVKVSKERIRVVLHVHNTFVQIDKLVEYLKKGFQSGFNHTYITSRI